MPSLSDRQTPSPRGQDIYSAITGAMHFYAGNGMEEMHEGISPEEHHRRHDLFVYAFLAGLEYTTEYPKQAISLLNDYRKHLPIPFSRARVDQAMQQITEVLYPQGPVIGTANKIIDLAQQYQIGHETTVEHVRPRLDNGALTWESIDGHPFPTWAEGYEDWSTTEQ